MGAANHKDTYKATAITLLLLGVLYLLNELLNFSSLGLGWILQKDTILLYTSIVFFLFKKDKSVGLVLLGLWTLLNFNLIVSLIGSLSGYIFPLFLLIVGAILYLIATK